MTTLIIVSSIILLLLIVLFIKAKVCFVGDNEEQRVYLSIGIIKINLYPQKTNPKKLLKKEKNKKESKNKQNKVEQKKEKPKLQLEDIKNLITFAIKFLTKIYRKFPKYFTFEMSKFKVEVGTEDAAKTAIMYGIIGTLATPLFELLESFATVKTPKLKELYIAPNFLIDHIEFSMNIKFSTNVFSLLRIAFNLLNHYLKNKSLLKRSNENGRIKTKRNDSNITSKN